MDDRNLRVADFAQFWATAKVYIFSFSQPLPCVLKTTHNIFAILSPMLSEIGADICFMFLVVSLPSFFKACTVSYYDFVWKTSKQKGRG